LPATANDGTIILTSGFSLQVYNVNFCKSEKTEFFAADVNGYETRKQR